jgi:hypothetical protein
MLITGPVHIGYRSTFTVRPLRHPVAELGAILEAETLAVAARVRRAIEALEEASPRSKERAKRG